MRLKYFLRNLAIVMFCGLLFIGTYNIPLLLENHVTDDVVNSTFMGTLIVFALIFNVGIWFAWGITNFGYLFYHLFCSDENLQKSENTSWLFKNPPTTKDPAE